MGVLKKIDHYLLTNHPILWRTKLHYFVLFSLILGNVAAFGLGYFSIKWFGGIELGIISTTLQVLGVFAILIWLTTQARNKIKHYHFWDEVLTYSIYVICTASLFGNLFLFGNTVTRTAAHLVSVEQIDIDRELVADKREDIYNGYDFSKPSIRVYPSYDVVAEMAERYRLDTPFDEEVISVRVYEISTRIDRIYESQVDLNMRQRSRIELDRLGLMCGWQQTTIDRYFWYVIIFLCTPVLLFLVSHTDMRGALSIITVYFALGMIGLVGGFMTYGAFPAILFVILCAIAVHGNGKINRFVSLLIIPYVLTFISGFTYLGLMKTTTDEIFSLVFCLIFISIATIFSSAHFIKRYFEPATM